MLLHVLIIRSSSGSIHCYLLKLQFRATNTIPQQLTEKDINKNPSGIYKLVCNICGNVYVGQSGRSINVRHKEHIKYIRTNNPLSAHILRNSHEYGTIADALELLTICQKGTHMNCWEALYIQIFHRHKVLITEQQVNDTNPLYEPANITRILPREPQPVSRFTSHKAHQYPGLF